MPSHSTIDGADMSNTYNLSASEPALAESGTSSDNLSWAPPHTHHDIELRRFQSHHSQVMTPLTIRKATKRQNGYKASPQIARQQQYHAAMSTSIRSLVAPPYLFPAESALSKIDDDEEKAPVANRILPSLTSSEKLIVAMLAFANFASSVVFSSIAPFFPLEAQIKQATESQIGWIFGIFELVIFICSPICGRYMGTIGAKFMYTTGLLITGCTSILFGLLNLAPPGTTFVALCFAVRTVEAIGDAAFLTASFSIIANEFPGRVASMIGMLETFSGLGFTLGPAIGGALYEAGGFGVPFWVFGTLLILAGLLSIKLIPNQVMDENSHRKGSQWNLLLVPAIPVMMLAILASAISLSFIDPTLQPHLSVYNLSALQVGFTFLLISGVYTVSAPIWGYIVDHKGHAIEIMLLGATLLCVSFLFLGPSPIFGLEQKLWLDCIAMTITGFGIGPLLIPPFGKCLSALLERGYPDNYHTYGMISGLFQSFFSMGAFIGPTLGASLAESIGFGYASTCISVVHACVIVMLITYLCINRRTRIRMAEEVGIVEASPTHATYT